MLNIYDIKYMIARGQWFDRTRNGQSYHQKAKDKGEEQKVDSGSDVSVYSTKTSGWSGLQISLEGSKQVTKYGSDLRAVIIMNSGTTTNMFGNLNMTTNK